MKDAAETSRFGERLRRLRQDRSWSQPEIGKLVGTSGDIIGRYECGDMTPSVEVARKLAHALGVTVDYLVGDHDLPQARKDPEMLDRWKALEDLPSKDRDHILYLVGRLIRDAEARHAHGTQLINKLEI